MEAIKKEIKELKTKMFWGAATCLFPIFGSHRGVCSVVNTFRSDRILRELVREEYGFFGAYFIPHETKSNQRAYMDCYLWTPLTKYGRERRRFTRLLIQRLEDEISKSL